MGKSAASAASAAFWAIRPPDHAGAGDCRMTTAVARRVAHAGGGAIENRGIGDAPTLAGLLRFQ